MPWRDVGVNGHVADGRGDDRDVESEERQMGVVIMEGGLTCAAKHGSEM